MVTSVGWNPFFDNKTRTVEPHLLHEFPADFYGSEIRIVMTGYLRPEANFDSLDALIVAIKKDIQMSRETLEHALHMKQSTHQHLRLGQWRWEELTKVGMGVCVAGMVLILVRKRLS